jgi:hypothetical protein
MGCGVQVGVGEQSQSLELVGVEQVGLVDDQHHEPTSFVFLGG